MAPALLAMLILDERSSVKYSRDYTPSQYTERVVAQQTGVLEVQGWLDERL